MNCDALSDTGNDLLVDLVIPNNTTRRHLHCNSYCMAKSDNSNDLLVNLVNPVYTIRGQGAPDRSEVNTTQHKAMKRAQDMIS